MARIKKSLNPKDTPVVEEIQKVSDKAASDYLGEDVKGGKVADSVKEEKVEAPVVVEDKETVVTKEEPKEFDPEKFKKEVVETVSKETADRITKALGGEEATNAQKDRYQQVAQDFKAKNGRNPTWFELIPFIKDDLRADLKAEEESKIKAQEEEKATQEEARKTNEKALNDYMDGQLDDLYKSGKLPKVVNKDDPNDLGVKSRHSLFQTMYMVNEERLKQGLPAIYSVKEIFYEHYKPVDEQPAGWDAPVSAGRAGIAHNEDSEDYSYAEIHKPRSVKDVFLRSIGKRS